MKFNYLSKILFDLIMLVLLAAVYCAQPTTIPVHEYIGLAVYIFFIIHLIYNYKWIINVGKKFFDKTVGKRIKVMYSIDLLLVVAFILIGFSGVMISHVIFKFNRMSVWRPLHSIASAISIILLAIHIGLHGKMIINTVKTKVKLPFIATKIIALVVFIIMLSCGIYGDIISKIQPSQNQVTGRPRYETVLALFQRSINLLSGPPEYVRNRMAGSDTPEYVRGRMTEGDSVINGGERQGPPNVFSVNTLLISVSNYMAVILLCSIIVFIIDSRIRKKARPLSVAE